MFNKKIFAVFVAGIIIVVILGSAISFIFAWTDPQDEPTNGEGAIFTDGNDLVINRDLRIEDGDLEIGSHQNTRGIQMYDQQNGQKKCLQIKNDVVFIKNGDCSS